MVKSSVPSLPFRCIQSSRTSTCYIKPTRAHRHTRAYKISHTYIHTRLHTQRTSPTNTGMTSAWLPERRQHHFKPHTHITHTDRETIQRQRGTQRERPQELVFYIAGECFRWEYSGPSGNGCLKDHHRPPHLSRLLPTHRNPNPTQAATPPHPLARCVCCCRLLGTVLAYPRIKARGRDREGARWCNGGDGIMASDSAQPQKRG